MKYIRRLFIGKFAEMLQECVEGQEEATRELAVSPDTFAAACAELAFSVYGVKAQFLIALLEVLGVNIHE